MSPEDPVEPGKAIPVEHQLVALTYTGGWYRLSLPTSSSTAAPSSHPPSPVPQATPSLRDPLSASPPSVKTISMARPRSYSGSSFASRPDKGKDREREEKVGRECILREFRRFGRWDGWG